MSAGKPLIGLCPGFDYDKNMLFAKTGYYEAVAEVGGIPVILPVTEREGIAEELVERMDGFLLCGGPDIDARYFGEGNLPFAEEISPWRDQLEIRVAKRAMERNKPILGICRGIQVMNVAMGGTIHQDIYAQANGRQLLKHSQRAPVWHPTHRVVLEKGTLLEKCMDSDCMEVNSFHHQAVRDIADGFRVTARSEDGIIEGIEHTAHRFAWGVQWHPELMWQRDKSQLKLFRELVAAAAER